MGRIYLDHHATTPIDLRVFEAMKPYLLERFGNAASREHEFGREAADAVEAARAQVAALIGADDSEIVFTSGATESDNLAVKGVKRDRIVTVATEHPAVLDSCASVEKSGGVKVIRLGVGPDGLIDLPTLK